MLAVRNLIHKALAPQIFCEDRYRLLRLPAPVTTIPYSSPTAILASLPALRAEILRALDRFAAVPREKWFREVLVCVMTPQSSPYRAEAAMVVLEERGFFAGALSHDEVADILRNSAHYVRFHRVKAARLLRALESRDAVERILDGALPPLEERDQLRRLVLGLGMKEASHALRNIGRRGLAILDRHILRVLLECGLLASVPRSISDARYREIEQIFISFAYDLGESPDVLDLYLWARATGSVFK